MTPVVAYPGLKGTADEWKADYAYRDEQAQLLSQDPTPSFFETVDQLEAYRQTHGPRAFS